MNSKLVNFKTFDQFNPSSLKIREFSLFNHFLKYYYETRLKCQINLIKFD